MGQKSFVYSGCPNTAISFWKKKKKTFECSVWEGSLSWYKIHLFCHRFGLYIFDACRAQKVPKLEKYKVWLIGLEEQIHNGQFLWETFPFCFWVVLEDARLITTNYFLLRSGSYKTFKSHGQTKHRASNAFTATK